MTSGRSPAHLHASLSVYGEVTHVVEHGVPSAVLVASTERMACTNELVKCLLAALVAVRDHRAPYVLAWVQRVSVDLDVLDLSAHDPNGSLDRRLLVGRTTTVALCLAERRYHVGQLLHDTAILDGSVIRRQNLSERGFHGSKPVLHLALGGFEVCLGVLDGCLWRFFRILTYFSPFEFV